MTDHKRIFQRVKRFLYGMMSTQGLFAVVAGKLLEWRYSFRNLFSRSPIAGGPGPTVSLTSYSKRIETVYLTLESIGNGSLRPKELILWLDEHVLVERPLPALRRLMRRGLQIRLCQNFGPHKKIHPFVEAATGFTEPLVTADDDIFYPRHWLRNLSRAYSLEPRFIHCYRARTVAMDGLELLSYSRWRHCRTTVPNSWNVAIGVSGVIYPPQFLAVLKEAGTEFLGCCPTADDIWHHVQAVRNGYLVRQMEWRPRSFLVIPGSQSVGLYQDNTKKGGNDEQIAATYSLSDKERLFNATKVKG